MLHGGRAAASGGSRTNVMTGHQGMVLEMAQSGDTFQFVFAAEYAGAQAGALVIC